jgi:hypothetical protein
VRVVATTYLRRDNALYLRKRKNKQQEISLAGYYIFKSILAATRNLRMKNSSDKQRGSSNKKTKANNFYDLPGKQTRFYPKRVKFQIAQ